MYAQPFVLLLLLNLLMLQGFGQTFFNAGGEQVWISDGAVVTVNGSLVNQGFMSNNGSVSVSGDWQNEGTYNAGTGQVILSGAQEQLITHYGQEITVLQLEGIGEKVLTHELLVQERLVLQGGILTTTLDAPLVLESEAEVSGGHDTSYVNGPVIYKGTGYRMFPVGKNGNYRPLELLDVQGVDPVLQVEVKEPNPSPGEGSNLEDVSEVRYWEVVTLQGTYTGSLVALAVGRDEGYSALSGVVVTAAEQVGGVFENLGQSDFSGNVTAGTVTSAQISAKPYLALGLTNEFSSRNKVLVPSAFAPDAPDPENRILKVYATNILPDAFVFKIFNRWGMLVYETTSLEEAVNSGWNGTNINTNQPAQFGVYTYYLSALLDNNLPIEQTGTITLFR